MPMTHSEVAELAGLRERLAALERLVQSLPGYGKALASLAAADEAEAEARAKAKAQREAADEAAREARVARARALGVPTHWHDGREDAFLPPDPLDLAVLRVSGWKDRLAGAERQLARLGDVEAGRLNVGHQAEVAEGGGQEARAARVEGAKKGLEEARQALREARWAAEARGRVLEPKYFRDL